MPSALPDPLIGRVVDDKYRVLEKIGAGSMGSVYRARHERLGAARALKVMNGELAQDERFVERFQLEARMVESLRHPSLVSLHDFGCLPEGTWYIVSELVEGETVAERLRQGPPFGSDETAALLAQIADGLAVAHRKGIVHRDISPDNIMITRGDDGAACAKLLDFGVAKAFVDPGPHKTSSSLHFGKLGYAAPEQIGLLRKGQDLDARADVFSLCAVGFEMLTGGLPWRKDSVQAYVHDVIVRPESEMRSAIERRAPAAWRSVLVRGLARDREQRTPTVVALRKDLRDAVRSAPKPLKRARLAALVAAVAVGAAALLWSSGAMRRTAPNAAPPSDVRRADVTPADRSDPRPAVGVPQASPHAAGPTLPPAPPPAGRLRKTDAPAHADPPTPVPAVAPGAVVVDASPPAAVMLDSEARGRTPTRLESIAPGTHALVLTTDDGRTYQEEIVVGSGATVERRHRFPGWGSASVVSEIWAEVRVDDGAALQTPCHIDRLVAGTHVLEAAHPGYKSQRVEFHVQEGNTTTVTLVLERR